MMENAQLTVRRQSGKLYATLDLEMENGNRLIYTAPVSGTQTAEEMELVILQTVKNRLVGMLPTQEIQNT